MKAFFSFVAALVLSLSMAAQNKSFYDFTVKTIDGKEYPLSGLKGKKVLVVNNFMGQEPGTNEEIAKFCSVNYDVTFPIMAKISVKGKDMAPLYHWLTEKKLNGKQDAPVQWNFQKFMIDENGNWVGFVAPKESPFSETIISWIEKN